jgi:hypothetical protein
LQEFTLIILLSCQLKIPTPSGPPRPLAPSERTILSPCFAVSRDYPTFTDQCVYEGFNEVPLSYYFLNSFPFRVAHVTSVCVG